MRLPISSAAILHGVGRRDFKRRRFIQRRQNLLARKPIASEKFTGITEEEGSAAQEAVNGQLLARPKGDTETMGRSIPVDSMKAGGAHRVPLLSKCGNDPAF
jgi:hypothetical protein